MYSTRDDFELDVYFAPPSPSIDIFTLLCCAEKIDLFGADSEDPAKFYIIQPSKSDQEQPTHLFEQLLRFPQHERGGKSVVVPMGMSPMRALPHGIGLISPVWTTETAGKLLSASSEKEDAQKILELDENQRPLEYIENDFEDRGDVVIDHATGLMWQKSGSENYSPYRAAQDYVEQLNWERFAGYDDWRLPTIEELRSLLKLEKQSNGLYINPIFDAKQAWCWSATQKSSNSVWYADFSSGRMRQGYLGSSDLYVRAVRSWQD